MGPADSGEQNNNKTNKKENERPKPATGSQAEGCRDLQGAGPGIESLPEESQPAHTTQCVTMNSFRAVGKGARHSRLAVPARMQLQDGTTQPISFLVIKLSFSYKFEKQGQVALSYQSEYESYISYLRLSNSSSS